MPNLSESVSELCISPGTLYKTSRPAAPGTTIYLLQNIVKHLVFAILQSCKMIDRIYITTCQLTLKVYDRVH